MDLPESIPWPDQTIEWWRAWWPAAAGWTATRQQYLLDTALVHASVWANGDLSKAGELRARCERMEEWAGNRQERKGTPLDELAARRRRRTGTTDQA